MDKADHPDQVRLRAYLDDTEELLAASKIDGSWVLRLDVGLPQDLDLLDKRDLDNFAYPLATRLKKNPGLVSVWCTKQHDAQSFVRIDAPRELPPPSTGMLVVSTPSAKMPEYKERIYAAVADLAELPAGRPVRLELAFVIGPIGRNWLELWKPTIDSLSPLLGRSPLSGQWDPCDGRIVELAMHLTVDPALRYEVTVGIAAKAL